MGVGNKIRYQDLPPGGWPSPWGWGISFVGYDCQLGNEPGRFPHNSLEIHVVSVCIWLEKYWKEQAVTVKAWSPLGVEHCQIYSLRCRSDDNNKDVTVADFVCIINTLRPRQDGRHFPDDIFKWIFLNENIWIPIKISLKFVPQGPIHNIPALVQIMAWRRPGDKPLSGPMMVRSLTHICVTRPQWVKWTCDSMKTICAIVILIA